MIISIYLYNQLEKFQSFQVNKIPPLIHLKVLFSQSVSGTI